jgi:DNA polymerase (family X)
MANEQLASILREMAFFAELQGENPFKIRAWQKSADLLEEQADEAAELVSSGQIAKIPGIGKGTQALVEEFVKSGSVGECESLKAKFPPYILELTEVRGLGPKKIKALYEQLGVGSLTELEYACEENRLLGLKGFGEKTQSGILENIAKVKANRGRAILPMALQQADEVREELRGAPWSGAGGGQRRAPAAFAGAGPAGFRPGRRQGCGQPRTGRICGGSGAPGSAPGAVLPPGAAHGLCAAWRVKRISAPGSWKPPARRCSCAGLGTLAQACRRSEEVFAARKYRASAAGKPGSRFCAAPGKLVEEKDIKGVFHLHTNWSDGKNTLEEMAAAALELGLEYLGVSDHSQTAIYAHGLDGKRLLEQRKEIDRVQEKFPSLRIFHGIESDILPDGSLDYPDELLKKLDFVIASVHGQMRMKPEEMTKRLCRVLEHPATTWLGHWTGRLLLGREGFQFDQEQVLEAAAKHGKGIELNSNPYRLDLDWSVAPEAARLGIPIGVFPDAHSAGGLADVRFGVWMARKAGLTAGQVVNTKSRKEMEAWLAERKFR